MHRQPGSKGANSESRDADRKNLPEVEFHRIPLYHADAPLQIKLPQRTIRIPEFFERDSELRRVRRESVASKTAAPCPCH